VKAATNRQHDETVPVQTYRFEVTDAGPRFVCPDPETQRLRLS
jgi:hypothetical protein